MSDETQQRLEEVKPGSQLRPEWTAGLEFKPKIKSDLAKDVSRKEIKLLQGSMTVDTQQRLEELKPGSQIKPKPGSQLRPEWTLGLEFKPMIKSNLAAGFDNRSFQIDSSNESMQLHQESSPGEITSHIEEGYQLRSYWRGHGSGLGEDKKPYQIQTVNEDEKGFQTRLDQGARTRAFQAQTRDDLLNPELKSISNFQEIKKSHSGAESQCKSEIRKGLGLLDKKPIQFQPRDEHFMPMRPDQDAGVRTGFSGRALQIQARDESIIQPRDELFMLMRPDQDTGLITGSVSQIQTRDENMMQTGTGPGAREESRINLKLDRSRSHQVQQISQAAGFDTEGQSGENSLERRAQFRQQLEEKLSLIFAERNFPKKVDEEKYSIDVPEGGWGELKIDLEAVTEEETEV
jgi:hypothetical protein